MAKEPEKKKDDKKKTPTKKSESDRGGGPIPNDYFKLANPAIIAVSVVVFFILMLCAISPDDCEMIPLIGELLAENADIIGILFWILLIINIVFTALTIKLCKKNSLTGSTTAKWAGQTLFIGFPSYKLLMDADKEPAKKK